MTSGSISLHYLPESSAPADERTDDSSLGPNPDRIYQELYPELKTFLRTQNCAEDRAEVLLQEVYLRLVAVENLAAIQSPRAYLLRLTRNLLIDHVRMDERDRKRFVELPEEDWDAPDNAPLPAEQVHYQQLLDSYQTAFTTLPTAVQEVIRLYHIEGLTQREIAQRIGKSPSWVEKAIARALLQCRHRLGDIDY